MSDSVERSLKLVNRRGLHARASARLARLSTELDAHITVEKDGHWVTASSIMGLLMLGAACGDTVVVRAEGDDAAHALDKVAELIDGRFGEDE